MRALIVFESMFGDTRVIARAIADGLASHMEVDTAEVGEAPGAIERDVDLLVVGGPTHAFGMSRTSTREDAARQARQSLVSSGTGLREWLDGVQGGYGRVAAASFDTTLSRPRLIKYFGTAARSAHKRLRQLGFRVIAPPESFYVAGTQGPLVDGEEERARRWGEQLGAKLAAAARG